MKKRRKDPIIADNAQYGLRRHHPTATGGHSLSNPKVLLNKPKKRQYGLKTSERVGFGVIFLPRPEPGIRCMPEVAAVQHQSCRENGANIEKNRQKHSKIHIKCNNYQRVEKRQEGPQTRRKMRKNPGLNAAKKPLNSVKYVDNREKTRIQQNHRLAYDATALPYALASGR